MFFFVFCGSAGNTCIILLVSWYLKLICVKNKNRNKNHSSGWILEYIQRAQMQWRIVFSFGF